jgi:hypothetical protein
VELFRASGLTGFGVRPVKARYKRADVEPPCLWELVVTGWAGMAPPESGVRLIEDCPACGLKVYSAWTNPERLIAPSQWDGSDFFMVWPLPMDIFVTEHVAQVIGEKRLSGGVLEPFEDITFPLEVVPKLSPGRLSYHMPEPRARELGEPLGIY